MAVAPPARDIAKVTTLPPTADPLDAAEAASLTRDRARRAMIDSQLRTSGVNTPLVLKRMGEVAREDHVGEKSRGVAYIDRALPLDGGGWIAAPLFYGMLLDEAAPRGGEHALVVDAGSGYLAALVHPLVAQMTVISPEDAVSGTKGKGADLLLIDGAVEHVPAKLANRLAEGARVVTGMIENGVTRLAIGRRTDSGVALLPVRDIGIPRLSAFDKPKAWTF